MTHGHVSAHLREWKTLPNVEVVAIADANREEREAYVRRFELQGVREYDSPAAMFEAEELHVASVCNETAAHAEVVEQAAARGVHCIVEKPLAFSLADAERMLAAAGKHGVQVLTNYPTRWGGRVTPRALEFVRQGGIGRPYEVRHRGGGTKPRAADANTFFRWLYQPRYNGAGAFMDYCCYGADMAVGVLGTPASVYAIAGRWQRDDLITDDNARMLLQYPRGGAVIEATWSQFGHLPFSTLFLGEIGHPGHRPRGGRAVHRGERARRGAGAAAGRAAPSGARGAPPGAPDRLPGAGGAGGGLGRGGLPAGRDRGAGRRAALRQPGGGGAPPAAPALDAGGGGA